MNRSIRFKRIRGLLSLFLIVLGNSVYSQKDTLRDNIIILTLAPIALVDIFDGASYRPGLEFKLRKNISFSVEAGGYLKYIRLSKIDPEGYFVKPVIKYYLNRSHRIGGRYIALEYQFKKQNYEFKDSLEVNDIRFEKQYPIRRTVNSVSVKYGDLINYGKHFILEWYCGAGVRIMRSGSQLTPDEQDGLLTGTENGCIFSDEFIRRPGNRVYPNFLVGLKIGYRIK